MILLLLPLFLQSSYPSPLQHNIVSGIPLETILPNRKQNSEQSASITTSPLPNGEYYADSLLLESVSLILNGDERTSLHHSPSTQWQNTQNDHSSRNPQKSWRRSGSILELDNSTVSMTSISAFLSRNGNSKTGIGGNAFGRYFGGSLATLTASSMFVSGCTLYLDGTASPFILKPSSFDNAPSTVELVHTKIIASDAVMGSVSEIESSDTPCLFDIVVFSTDLDSICVMGGNSLSFRHSLNRNTDSTSFSTVSSSLVSNSFTNVTSSSNHHSLETSALSQRCIGSTITKSVGALQGTIVSDFNSGGSLLCSNTTFAKCTATPTIKKDAIVHKSFNVFFSNYFKSFRPEFRFEDTHFSGQKQHKFTSLRHYQNTFPVDPLAIFATSASPIIFSHCSFSELVRDPDDDDFSGGLAIFLRTPAPLTVTSCSFTDIHSERSGAAICSETVFDNLLATLVIENSTFTRCQASGDGGAMFYQYEGLISITSSSFLENSCSGSGGACFSYGCDYSFCRFEGNSANRGGAIFGTERTSIRFCHFKNTKSGGDWYSWSPIEMAFGCTRSGDWTEGSEVVVMGNGEGEECSASQPCQTLATGLKKASMTGKDIIHVGSGWTGSTTIEQSSGHLTLRGYYQLEEGCTNPHTPTSSFSITVGQVSDFTLDSLSLSPADGIPLLKSESNGGSIQMTNIQIANIIGITAPLFVFSTGSLTMSNSRFEHLSQITGNLISISGPAYMSLDSVLFRNIDLSSALFIVSYGGSLTISQCLFHTITRTEGSGAAVIDMNDCHSLEISSSTFSHCHSMDGQAGVFTVTRCESSHFAISAFFINNKGKTEADAHDIFYTGFGPEDLPWSSSTISSFSDFPQVASSHGLTGTLPVFSTFSIVDEEHVTSSDLSYQPTLFTKDLRFADIGQSLLVQNIIKLFLDTPSEDPIVIKPVHMSSSTLTLQAPTTAFKPHLQQSPESQGSFFVVEGKSNLSLLSLFIIVTSGETEPLIKIDLESSARLSHCLITSDGSVIRRSIVQSSGDLQVSDSTLFDLTFDNHSCFECLDGHFSLTTVEFFSTSCASNITTTGDGAFLNAQNCIVDLGGYHFFDCHARNGGVAFCQACSSLSANSEVFVGCSATQNGGAIAIQSFIPSAEVSFMMSCFVNCSAELGGGLFVNSSDFKRLGLSQPWTAWVFGHSTPLPIFLDCSASKGACAYFDGVWSVTDCCHLRNLVVSNGGLPSTSQDFFISASVAESLPEFEQIMKMMKYTCFSMSSQYISDSSPSKLVEIEGGSVPSWNLYRPILVLQPNHYDDFCQLDVRIVCSSIHRLLGFFHTKNEDGEFVQVPIFLESSVSFFETGVVRSQSAIFKTDTNSNHLDPIQFFFPSSFWKHDSFFLRVEKDGTAELSSISFSWEADLGFCEVVDESGRMAITSSTFDVNTDLTHSLVVCSAGTLVIAQSTFTSTDSAILVKCPLVASFRLSSLFSNTVTESLMVEMDTVTFSALTMHESVDEVVHLEGADSLRMKKVSFKTVLCESEEAVRIVVVGSDLGGVIEYVPESDFPQQGSGVDGLYRSLDLSEPLSSAFRAPTLLFYLHRTTAEKIIVSSDGRDGVWCGNSSFPCLSLNEADAHLQPGFPSRIVVAKGTVLKSELDLTQDITEIKAMGGEKSHVEVWKDGSLVNQADTLTHSLTLESLIFSLSVGRMTPLLVSRSGLLSLASCSFVSSDSSSLASKLVEVSGGSVKMAETDFTLVSFSGTLLSFSSFVSVYLQHVSHRSCSPHPLMLFEGKDTSSTVEMRDCVFKGEPTQTTSANQDDVICEWENGLIVIENCSFDGFSSKFSHLPIGALRAIDSSVSLTTSQFELNGLRASSFPSLSWNIACTGSSVIELDSSSSDVSTSHWISASELCVVKRSDESQISEPFFVPTLSLDACSSTYSSTTKHYSVVISGSTLIPCGLSLIVFEVNNGKEGKSLPFVLPSSFASHHNETSISLELNASSLKELDSTFAWNASLRFGKDGRTSSFQMKRSNKEIRAETMGKTLPWLIPLIVSLFVLLLVAVIVFVLCRRRRMKPSQNMSEMKEQEAIQIEDDKVEVEQETQQGVHANDAKDPLSMQPNEEQTKPDHIQSSSFDHFENVVEALHCGQRLEMRVVREQDTLYNVLHVFPEKKKTIVKSVISRQLALGLARVADASMNATVLTNLSSHWVMFDSSGSVCLKTRDASPANPPPIPLPNSNGLPNEDQKGGNPQQVNHALEGQRWRAPEVVKEENEKVTENEQAAVDPRKAAVFSLGLVLWEIETGLVPFGEIDATNAQRQLGTGILPKMDGVGSEMKDLISECLQLNPSDRPSLSDVSNCLISLATAKPTDGEEADSDR